MAPSVAHLHSLVARNTKLFKAAWQQTKRLLEDKIPQSIRTSQAELQPVYLRNAPKQPIHPVAYIRQSKGRWYTTHSTLNAALRRFTTSARPTARPKFDRASLPKSRTGAAVYASTGRAPFASTLRPNLTGGAFARTAGGYGLGSGAAGSARFFSHTPASPAQVVHSVSQAVRAFVVSGQKARFDGVNPHTGAGRYRAVSTLQDALERKVASVPKAVPGSYIDFNINPTVTALTPLPADATGLPSSLSAAPAASLNADGLLDVLAVDFARALRDLAGTLTDLERLRSLGDLPVTYRRTGSLRVHFPGCDADAVERLCVDLGVARGVVRQDPGFDRAAGAELALLFPLAPSGAGSEAGSDGGREDHAIDWRGMMSPPHHDKNHHHHHRHHQLDELSLLDECSARSELDLEYECVGAGPTAGSPLSGYETVGTTELEEGFESRHAAEEYEGIEGVWRFMEQCRA